GRHEHGDGDRDGEGRAPDSILQRGPAENCATVQFDAVELDHRQRRYGYDYGNRTGAGERLNRYCAHGDDDLCNGRFQRKWRTAGEPTAYRGRGVPAAVRPNGGRGEMRVASAIPVS